MLRARKSAILFAIPHFLFLGAPSRAAEPEDAIEPGKLKAHVEALASDGFEGRGPGEGTRKARDYVASAFEKAGLKPAGSKGYLQEIRARGEKGKKGEKEEKVIGCNVLGLIPGSDPVLKKEHVILSAHHDHLGKNGKEIFHGADDDATGVAVLLETARVLVQEKAAPKRSLLFISFDLEERGLEGSVFFTANSTVPIESVALFINMDMLGRDLGDFVQGYLFALGTEHSPSLRAIVRKAAAGTDLKVGLVGTDVIGIRGDYGPFQHLRIPYLFFSTGENLDYHRPTDSADRILYEKLGKNARIVLRSVLSAAALPERPSFAEPEPDIDEVRVMADIIDQIVGKAKDLNLKKEEMAAVSLISYSVKEILKKGEVSKEEREELKGLVQQIMGSFSRR